MSGGGQLVQQNGLRAEGFASGPARLFCGIPCRTGRAAHLPSVRSALPSLGHAVLWRDGVLCFSNHFSSSSLFRAWPLRDHTNPGIPFRMQWESNSLG